VRHTFGVLNHTGVVSFHNSNTRVGGTKIDSNNTVRKTITHIGSARLT